MNVLTSIFSVRSLAAGMLLAFAAVLLIILVISFRSRAVVFCQYLQAMTGVKLKPYQVAKVYRERGPDGVREFFLDLIIKEDLKQGPLVIPSDEASGH
jgi:hypothetical protein